MKILLVNHATAGDWGGGDGVQIRETAKRLRQRGHEVVEVNSDQPNTHGFDIVHIFNCRVTSSFEQQINSCKLQGSRIIVSPIWINIKRAFWGSRGTNSVLQEVVYKKEKSTFKLLENLQHRKLVVCGDGGNIEADGHGDLDIGSFEATGELLNQVDGLLPNSWLELQSVRSDLNWVGNCFEVAHYGVDSSVFLDADPTVFQEYSNIRTPFVMQAGRIEPAKNQAMLCWALRECNTPIVLVGSSKNWPAYADLCKEISGSKLKIFPHLPQDLLASAYAAASVHVLPSWMETCGLVSLEAALSGTPIVGSTFGHELEYLEGDAWYGDPANPASIRMAVKDAMKKGRNSTRTLAMKRKVLEKFNWERTVDQTLKLYNRVLNNG